MISGYINKIVVIFCFLFSAGTYAQKINIIPQPVILEIGSGQFVLDNQTSINFKKSDKELKNAALFFQIYISDISGISVPFNQKKAKAIELKLINDSRLGSEGYILKIETGKIIISANSRGGIIYGMQSLFQLLPAIRTNADLAIPVAEIVDYPRFQWRGMHLDVCRHFFSPETVKQYIDLLSMYKFNTFHWHLSDDQGWRIEIKKYPKLTETGAWRPVRKGIAWDNSNPGSPGEPNTYGGYYTQQQVKDIVRYAAERNITIVPEIDVPGHSGAAIAAYPFLGCTGKDQPVITGGVYPDSIQTSLCVSKDTVYGFMKNVLNEIMDLFPSPFIHIGGDEVNKDPWKNDPFTQDFMRRKNIPDEDALQSYFIHEMEKIINERGRRMVGWDEILEGGLAPDATVMSWRGESGGIESARMKHNVVMTPGNPLYFDHYQAGPEGEPEAFGGMNTLQSVYNYDPIPDVLNAEEAKYILGAQANLWTEFIYSRAHVEYMVLPRMLALAEVVWSPKEKKNYPDFFSRTQAHFDIFDHKGLNYCEGNYNVNISPVTENGKVSVSFTSENPDATILYTTDGSYPGLESEVYKSPFEVSESLVVKAVVAVDNKIRSKAASEQSFVKGVLTGKPVAYKYPYSNYYQANGPYSLTDGIRGKHAVGKYWHGFAGQDMIATIDMGSAQPISEVSAGFLQRYTDWIFLPVSVTVEVSDDGINFRTMGTAKNTVSVNEKQSTIKDFTVTFDRQNCRYIRVSAKNLGVCPPGHPGEGKPAWLFADEIIAR